MKAFKTVLKILAALAAIAGIVYVVATYGDKITAWAKQILDKLNCCCGCCDCECECECCDCEEVESVEGAVEEADFEG